MLTIREDDLAGCNFTEIIKLPREKEKIFRINFRRVSMSKYGTVICVYESMS